jgi:subtilisin family serine protease
MRVLMLTGCLLLASLANAQMALPSVRLPVTAPTLPNLPATDVSLQSRLDAEFQGTDLKELRALHVRTLLRAHGDLVEADSHGDPMVRGEVLVVSPDATALQAAAAAGFSVAREFTLDVPPVRIVVLHVATRTARAVERLRALDPGIVSDFNHIYIESGAVIGAGTASQSAPPNDAAASGAPAASAGRIGLIDSGVDSTHEVFSGLTVHQHGCSSAPVPGAHGTAVASLMVGRAAALHGAAPGSELYAADVYCGLPTGGAVQTVTEAFSWLAHEGVPVINVSLVGPPNRILETVVESLIARGHIVVAAVGNDGPGAPPLYPAAWPGVVGVTAVDAHQRALAEAARGAQVKFAAPGAQMAAAKRASGYTLVRGTSFAAPIVAGLLSLNLQVVDKVAADKAVATLASQALHLGAPGPDPVYGYGLVGASLRRQPALAAFRVD